MNRTISALPAAIDLSLYAGDDFFLDVTVTDVDGNPTDLTGAVVASQIRTKATDTEILAEFGATVEGNVIHLHLTHTDATGLPGSAVWDCQTDTDGVVSTLVAGNVTTRPEVTRP